MHWDISATNLMIYLAKFDQPIDERSLKVAEILKDAKCRRGLIINYDYTSFIDPHKADLPSTSSSSMEADLATNLLPPGPSTAAVSPNYADLAIDDFGVRMEMAPFMAMHLLMHPAAQHCIGYDLESLYHILIFVLTQIKDFSKTDNQKFHMANLPKPICKWFSRHLDLDTLGEIKTTQFHV
ncbi:hypothetical protein H0H87_010570 [Tephrocybe sp. NHM501043]|nr:hypothetical protein H0H87_010570 [Tephrocybe sp. NHM501043]